MDSPFIFKIFRPAGQLSPYVQGVWSASVALRARKNITRWLHSDAGSGILFNLNAPIYLGDTQFSAGVILLPVKKQAQSITLSPGAQLVGLRFHPAIGFGVLGRLDETPIAIEIDDVPFALHVLCAQLAKIEGHYARIVALYRWLNGTIDFSGVAPASLMYTLHAMQSGQTLAQLSEQTQLGQRQLERQFKRWMGMTAKHYQRIVRVKNSLDFLKHNPDVNLVDLALDHGFTDQAHMTREFKQIARITPGQYSKRVACRQTD